METAKPSLTLRRASAGGNLHHESDMSSIMSAGDLDLDMPTYCVKKTKLSLPSSGMANMVVI
jgi:hypothetical protein